MYKISLDFEELENLCLQEDDNNYNTHYINYIFSLGLQKSYEHFMDHKHKFIEIITRMGMNTMTVKELISTMEKKVDYVIDNSSPELKSGLTADDSM